MMTPIQQISALHSAIIVIQNVVVGLTISSFENTILIRPFYWERNWLTLENFKLSCSVMFSFLDYGKILWSFFQRITEDGMIMAATTGHCVGRNLLYGREE